MAQLLQRLRRGARVGWGVDRVGRRGRVGGEGGERDALTPAHVTHTRTCGVDVPVRVRVCVHVRARAHTRDEARGSVQKAVGSRLRGLGPRLRG